MLEVVLERLIEPVAVVLVSERMWAAFLAQRARCAGATCRHAEVKDAPFR